MLLSLVGVEKCETVSGEPQANLMLARYYSSSLGRFMAVDPGDDTALEEPQSWNKYAYVRNNPLILSDPTGRSAANETTDPATHQAVDSLVSTPTFQAVMDDPTVSITFTNVELDQCSGVTMDGGSSSYQYDPATGTTTIEVGIDPSMAGAGSASLGELSPSQVGTPEAVDALVRVEAALGVLAVADAAGTAEQVKKDTTGHALIKERQAIAGKLDAERDAKKE